MSGNSAFILSKIQEKVNCIVQYNNNSFALLQFAFKGHNSNSINITKFKTLYIQCILFNIYVIERSLNTT